MTNEQQRLIVKEADLILKSGLNHEEAKTVRRAVGIISKKALQVGFILGLFASVSVVAVCAAIVLL